jgi:hypothetical protein
MGRTKGKSAVGIGGLDHETGTGGSGRAAAGAKRATGGGPSSAAHGAEQWATDLREGRQGAGTLGLSGSGGLGVPVGQ